MSTITTINANDQATSSRSVINTNFANLNADKAEKTSPTIATARFTGVNSFAEAAPVLLTGSERVQFEDADGNGSDWSFRVAGGGYGVVNTAASNGTLATPTVVTSSSTLGEWIGWGYDGGNYRQAAKIRFKVSTTPGSSDMPGKIEFYTTPDSSTTPGLALDIDHNKVTKFYGSLNINGNSIVNTGTLTLPTATDTLVGRATTDTLSNKRVTKRVVTVTQSATPTVNTDNTDVASITGLAQAITSMTTNLSGTPVAGDLLMIQITDNGTARAITWGASFASTTVTLPTTTVISTMLRVGFQWNSTTSKWDCIAVA
jgi:hypothetical protein